MPEAPAAAPAPRPAAPPAFAGPGGFGALTTGALDDLRLPGQHFAAAALFLVLGAAGLIWVAPELAAGVYLSPHVAGVTHLFTLGCLTITIFGALYQLLPVALGARVRSRAMGHASFWTLAPGVALFATGVAISSVPLHHSGVTLVAIGILLAIVNIGSSLPRSRTRDVTWAAIVIGFTFLLVAATLGTILVHNLQTGFLRDVRVRFLATHLHIAMLGWVLVMIIGMSHRLMPMFTLAHGADTRWTRRALTLLVPGVIVLACGIAHPMAALEWIGLVLVEGAIACFMWQVRQFYIKRKRPKLDAGLRHAVTALGFLGASALLGPVVLVMGTQHPRLATTYIIVGLLGGLLLYMLGFFYKIVPFLFWITRYRGRVGRERVPTIADLYSQRAAHTDLVLFVVAITALAIGVLAGSSIITRLAAVTYAAAVALFASQIARVIWGKHE